jgi:hypothetical protein
MFDTLDRIFNGTQPLVVREEIRVPTDRIAGCDIVRIDDLGRRIVVIPKGQPVRPDIPLTKAEQEMVQHTPPAVRRVHEHGTYRLEGW